MKPIPVSDTDATAVVLNATALVGAARGQEVQSCQPGCSFSVFGLHADSGVGAGDKTLRIPDRRPHLHYKC